MGALSLQSCGNLYGGFDRFPMQPGRVRIAGNATRVPVRRYMRLALVPPSGLKWNEIRISRCDVFYAMRSIHHVATGKDRIPMIPLRRILLLCALLPLV